MARVPAEVRDNPAVSSIWARGHIRELEDRLVTAGGNAELEKRIVETSLRFGVLCRFTAFVAVDTEVVTDGTPTHRVLQPVEPAAGWDMLADAGFAHPTGSPMMTFAGAMTPARAGRPARERPIATPLRMKRGIESSVMLAISS